MQSELTDSRSQSRETVLLLLLMISERGSFSPSFAPTMAASSADMPTGLVSSDGFFWTPVGVAVHNSAAALGYDLAKTPGAPRPHSQANSTVVKAQRLSTLAIINKLIHISSGLIAFCQSKLLPENLSRRKILHCLNSVCCGPDLLGIRVILPEPAPRQEHRCKN